MVFTSRLLGRQLRARVPAGEHVSTRTCQTPAAVSLTRSSVTSTCAGRRARIDAHVSDSGSHKMTESVTGGMYLTEGRDEGSGFGKKGEVRTEIVRSDGGVRVG
jgi:hypothetical protein